MMGIPGMSGFKGTLEALREKIEAEFHDNPLSRLLGELHAEVAKLEARVTAIEEHPAVSIPPLASAQVNAAADTSQAAGTSSAPSPASSVAAPDTASGGSSQVSMPPAAGTVEQQS